MKLKKLEITNIASIASATVDFTTEPLASSPIFLICGETGSGKSTILDAICLALYNKTPRLANTNKTEENVYKEGSQTISVVSVNQLLKKGEKEGGVSLRFEGADGTEYLAEWKCKVNRNGKLENETWTVTDSKGMTDASKGKSRESRMSEIIGMDYNEFCRTSMLAQGQFTQFLKADTKDKSDILEKITGTEIYAEIGSLIHNRAKAASEAFKDADKDVNSIELLPKEKKEELVKEMAAIDTEIMISSTAVKLLEDMIKAFEDIEKAKDNVKAANETIELAKATFSTLAGDIAFKKAEMKEKQAKAETLSKQIDSVKGHALMYDNIQSIESALGDVIKQRGVIVAQKKDLEEAEREKERIMGIVSDLEKKKAQADKELAKKEEAVKEAKAAMEALNPDGVESERKAISEELEQIGNANADFAAIQLKDEGIKTAKKEYGTTEEEIAVERVTLDLLKGIAEAAGKDYSEILETYNRQAQVLDAAAVRLREWLRETGSDECPVCHAKITSLTTSEQEEDRLKPLKDHVEKLKAKKEEAERKHTEASTTLSTKEKDHLKAKGKIEEEEKSLARLKGDFATKYTILGITGIEDNLEKSLNELKVRLEGRRTANEDAIKAVNAKRDILNEAIRERDSFKKDSADPLAEGLNKGNNDRIAVDGRIKADNDRIEAASKDEKDSLEKARALVSSPDWEGFWEENHDAFTDRLKKEASNYNDALKEREKFENDIKKINDLLEEATSAHDRIIALDTSFEPDQINPASFQGNAMLEWGALESKVRTAKDAIEKSSKAITDNNSILETAFNADKALPHTEEELLDTKQQLGDTMIKRSGRRGELNLIIEEDERKEKNLGKKIEAREHASKLNAQWKTLDDLFGGADGFTFKKIAQSYIMQDILNHANAYLKKIAPRYELTAQPGSLLILVKDNDEGVVRSGNTLSGGEGFVISLALALGLSSLAESSISVDTIFIDEGFGTLSQEWLNSVMSALEKLNSASGKHVGIISHIEDLQKRIPTVIEVKKKNATTSEVNIRG